MPVPVVARCLGARPFLSTLTQTVSYTPVVELFFSCVFTTQRFLDGGILILLCDQQLKCVSKLCALELC